MFRAMKQHATGSGNSKVRHGMNLNVALDKSLLLTISQKGSENMITPMSIKQVSLQVTDLAENWTCQKQITTRHDKLSIHTSRRHGIGTRHGKNNIISCKDQLQQAWQNRITCKQSASNILKQN